MYYFRYNLLHIYITYTILHICYIFFVLRYNYYISRLGIAVGSEVTVFLFNVIRRERL